MLPFSLLSRAGIIPALWLKRAFVRCLIASVFVYLPALHAVIFEPLSIPSLSREADLIVEGTVVSQECLRDNSGRIYTRVELRVVEIWKGAVTGNPLVIVHGGGTFDGHQTTIAGQVSYRVGEEVVVFLTRNKRGEAVTLGLLQGKFQVWTDPRSGVKKVIHPFHSPAAAASSETKSLASTEVTSGNGLLRLTDLKQRVLEAKP